MNTTANKSKTLLKAKLKGCASDYCVSTPKGMHGATLHISCCKAILTILIK